MVNPPLINMSPKHWTISKGNLNLPTIDFSGDMLVLGGCTRAAILKSPIESMWWGSPAPMELYCVDLDYMSMGAKGLQQMQRMVREGVRLDVTRMELPEESWLGGVFFFLSVFGMLGHPDPQTRRWSKLIFEYLSGWWEST